MMMFARLTFLLPFAFAAAASGQTVVEFPPLTITGSALQASVTYDNGRHIYRYDYVLTAPATNKANLCGFAVDISGKTPHEQLDGDLQNNVRRYEESGMGIQPSTAIPIGINVPNPAGVTSMIGKTQKWSYTPKENATEVPPGSKLSGVFIESKFPPAMRDAVIHPCQSAWDEISFRYEGQNVTFVPETAQQYDVHLNVPAPGEPSDDDLFNGGGQQPAEVNRFLRYASPLENRVRVPAGTPTYIVIVYYGHAIDRSTFTATLNDVDISSQFQPAPDTAQVLEIPLSASTTKLQLSVEGTKGSGRTARDTDTLTFLAQ